MLLSFVLSLLLLSPSSAWEETEIASTYDLKTSPYTGYTRATWVAAAEKIISGVMNYVNPETGIFSYPPLEGAFAGYMKPSAEDRIREMERIMVGVVEYYVGTGKDNVPGYKGSITQPFINAYIHGTDPSDPLYWGEPQKADQTGSGIVLGLYLAPERFWDPLTDIQKKNLLTYLEKNSINPTWDNNHYLFHLLTTRFLEEHGGNGYREYHTAKLERLLGWYRGDGWYIDGDNRGFDYYNLWGFQLYMNWILRFDPLWSARYGDRIRDISSKFMGTAPYLYSRSSGHIPWGRSLTYRFAADAAIGWNVINGNGDMDPGLARRLMSGDLKYFLDHGAVSENGLIEVGYRGKNTALAEHYNSPLDSYFATQSFCVLLLPEDHPFWTAVEKPSPADRQGGRKAIKAGGFVLNVRPDGDARIYFAGQTYDRTHWQASAKYMQEAYSADLGFCVAGGNSAPTGQGMTGWSLDGNDWMYRWRSRTLLLEQDHIASFCHIVPSYKMNRDSGTPEFDCQKVFSHTLIGERGEVRIFWHDNPDPIRFRCGGYGIQVSLNGDYCEKPSRSGLELSSGNYRSVLRRLYGPEGKFEAILQRPGEGWTDTHLFGGSGAWPRWESKDGIPPFTPVVLFVDGSAHGESPLPDVRVARSADGLEIRFEGRKYNIEIRDDLAPGMPDWDTAKEMAHPRLFLNEAEKAVLLKNIRGNSDIKLLHKSIIAHADFCVADTVQLAYKFDVSGRRLLEQSRYAQERIFFCAYAWRMTGKEKYLSRVKEDILTVCAFPDWHTKHFLDTAEMALAVAIGLDWCYSGLPVDVRDKAAATLRRFALDKYKKQWFTTADNNWNQVCYCGLAAAAIAAYEWYPAVSRELLTAAVTDNRRAMAMYGPDGVYPEGYVYWSYGTGFETMLLEMLRGVYGTDTGLSDAPGFMQTGTFMKYMAGTSGRSFSYSDGSDELYPLYAMWWFAARQSRPDLLESELALLRSGKYFLDRDWMRFAVFPACMAAKFSLTGKRNAAAEAKLWAGGGPVPVVLIRTGWKGSPDERYLAFKGGYASYNHGHMDAGSFVFDAFGRRWACDLGSQTYADLEQALKAYNGNFWDVKQESFRWKVFRLQNQAHNTLTVGGMPHNVDGKARIVEVVDTDEARGGTVDLTPVFTGQLSSACRKILLLDDDSLSVTDAIAALPDSPAVIDWRMVTDAAATITDKGILLEQGGYRMLLTAESDDPTLRPEYKIWPAVGPEPWDAPNPGKCIVGYSVTLAAGSSCTIKVTLKAVL